MCVNCKAQIDRNVELCDACLGSVKFFDGDLCIVCGGAASNSRELCSLCVGSENYISALKSVFLYNESSRRIILDFKFYDYIFDVKVYTNWICKAGWSVLENAELLLPVPMHRARLLYRKYNQSSLLVRAISKQCGIASSQFALRKVKNTRPQHELPAKNRARNVNGSFAITNPNLIRNKTVVLVDDVITTGATMQACAKILLRAGAKEVRGLTLGRALPA